MLITVQLVNESGIYMLVQKLDELDCTALGQLASLTAFDRTASSMQIDGGLAMLTNMSELVTIFQTHLLFQGHFETLETRQVKTTLSFVNLGIRTIRKRFS